MPMRIHLNHYCWNMTLCRWTPCSRWEGLCNMASLTCSTLSGVRAQHGHTCGVQSFTDTSWCHFDIHSSRVLWLGASHLGNCCSEIILCSCNRPCFDKQFHCRSAVLNWPALHQLNSKHHCTWWRLVWKRRVTGTLVFKFQKPWGVFGAPCI